MAICYPVCDKFVEFAACDPEEYAWSSHRDVSTLSSAAERIRSREKQDHQIAEDVAALSQQIAQLQA